jgi:membrane associated rhomboid family serine protease
MLPLKDPEPNHYSAFPFMTIVLILLNGLVFMVEIILEPVLPARLHYLLGSVPLLVLNQQGGGALASLTSMFLHGGILHLLGNMLFLWVFGRRVEDACGPARFVLFYLMCGFFADMLSTIAFHRSPVPSIGASGAIAGLLGAYLILYPGSRIRTLILVWWIPVLPKIRVFWFALYFFFIQQLIPVLLSTRNGINYWAHIGGFTACIFIIFFMRPEAFARYLSNEPV